MHYEQPSMTKDEKDKRRRKRVAVVGSGIAGLSALWALTQDGFQVDLYEKEDRIGGDAHTIEYRREGKEACWVETAFLLLHEPGWPNFFRFLVHDLGVELQPSTASLSITSRGEGAEGEWGWGSTSLWTLFPSWSDLLDPSRYRLLYDILRFNHSALAVLRDGVGVDLEVTVSEYLEREGYSNIFRDRYLLPLFSCIHSIPLSASARYPIVCLVQMFHNLRLLQLWGKPQWFVISGGSQSYVRAILDTIQPDWVHTGEEVVAVDDTALTLSTGEKREYDHIILATHSDVTRRLLQAGNLLDPSLDRVLSSWTWEPCEMHVHHDETVMPQDERLHAAWNGQVTSDHISATFDMNLLLSLPAEVHGRILTTLNPHPLYPVDPSTIVSTQRYAQPVLSADIVRSQIRLAELQGQPPRYSLAPSYHLDEKRGEGPGCEAIRAGKVVIAGAWTGRGIHEDGFVSGLMAAERVGGGERRRALRPVDAPVIGVGCGWWQWVGRWLLILLGWLCGWA